MHAQSTSEENSAAGLTPTIEPSMPWRVVAASALPDYRVKVSFRDGVEGVLDMHSLIHAANAGVFTALRAPAIFADLRVDLGALTWSGAIDLAPDAIHRFMKEQGGDCAL
jgi:hypothetical protein